MKKYFRPFAVVVAGASMFASTAVATAQPTESIQSGSSQSATEAPAALPDADNEAEVTKSGNVTTIESSEGTATITENVEENTFVLVNVRGEERVFDRQEVLQQAQDAEAGAAGIQPYQINRDWKAYLCNAAVAAATGTNSTAWRLAVAASLPFRFIPIVNAAVLAGHAGAGIFLSTQC